MINNGKIKGWDAKHQGDQPDCTTSGPNAPTRPEVPGIHQLHHGQVAINTHAGLTVRKEILQGRGGGHPVPRYPVRSVGLYSNMPRQGRRGVSGQAHRTAPHHHHLRQSQQSSDFKPDGMLGAQKSDSCHSRDTRHRTTAVDWTETG